MFVDAIKFISLISGISRISFWLSMTATKSGIMPFLTAVLNATPTQKTITLSLYGFRFSRVAQKTERMNRTLDNIQLPEFPKSVAELLDINEAS